MLLGASKINAARKEKQQEEGKKRKRQKGEYKRQQTKKGDRNRGRWWRGTEEKGEIQVYHSKRKEAERREEDAGPLL